MKAQVIKVGDELAIVLPNEIVAMLAVKEGQRLFVSPISDGGFRIGASDPVYEEGMRIAEDMMVK